MGQRIKTVLLAAVASTTLVLGIGAVAAPASAGTANCSLGYSCAWQYKNYEGKYVAFYDRIERMGAFGFDNRTSSVQNNGRTSNARFYQHSYYGGDNFLLKRGYLWSSMGSWDNKVSSAKFV